MHDFEEKNILEKREFDEKIIFKNQSLKEILRTKKHVLIQSRP